MTPGLRDFSALPPAFAPRASALRIRRCHRGQPGAGARGFTLLEVLLAIALLGSLLVALNVFVFSMAEVWGKGKEERLFAQHARAVAVHVEEMLRQAALSPEGAGLEIKEVKLEEGGEAPELAFTLAEGSRLITWPETALPDVEMSLGVAEREGLRLHWQSRLEMNRENEAPRSVIVTPFVASIGWDYYDENFRRWETLETPKREADGTYPLPRRIRLRFVNGKLALERVLRVPGAREGATRL